MNAAKRSRQAGFSFIEILVVMGIISVLVSMVVVLIPNIQEKGRQTKSKDNVKNMVTLMVARRTEKISGGYPPYTGKNFVLSLVATGQLDRRNKQNLETLFSPGDQLYTMEKVEIERYNDVKKSALKDGDFHDLTSYAGRRNRDPEHLVTSDQEKMGTMLICDDDDGALHHSDGLVTGWSNGAARFMEWEELDMLAPEDPDAPEPFLGDDSENEMLQHMWGR